MSDRAGSDRGKLLDVRRLSLLRDFAAFGTVAATAESAQLTGPAVSQQLAALERAAGVPLLEKQGRGLQLTDAGRRLVGHAEVILGGLLAAEADLESLRGGTTGVIRVAAFPSAARVLLPFVWRHLTTASDRAIDLRIADHEPDAAIEALRQRQADIAIVHSYNLLPRDLPTATEQHHLLDDPVVLAMHPDLAAVHRLTRGSAADLARFADENWLLPTPGTTAHELTLRACGAAGFVPAPVATATDFSVLTALAAADAGVALIPRMALPADIEGVSLHRLKSPVTRAVSALVPAGAGLHPSTRQVLDLLKEAASRPWRP